MAKFTPDTVTSGHYATLKLNENFERIQTAFENTLSRDGTSPNQMEANLDLNSYRILNLPAPQNDNEPLRKGDVTTEVNASTGVLTSILDTEGVYTSDNVEGALEELGFQSKDKVDSVQALRDRNLAGHSSGDTVFVSAHTTAGDGGHGVFRYVSGEAPATYTDNNGTIVVPTGGDGSAAWLREYDYVTPEMFGAKGDGAADDTLAFKAAALHGGKVHVPSGTYLIYDQIDLPNNFDWSFERGSLIKNMLEESKGTAKALFRAEGSAGSIGVLDAGYKRGHREKIKINGSVSIQQGDVLSFADDYSEAPQFYANVVSVESVSGGSEVVLDRTPSTDLREGSTVYRISPTSGTFDGANFDFNGTVANPRYGYGFRARNHTGVIVKNIRAKNIGSKVVELSRGFDSEIDGVVVDQGVDTTSGHGYAIRLANSSDCVVRGVTGKGVRHTVDLASSSRNKIHDCVGIDNAAVTFMTHFNGSVGNSFYNCDVFGGSTGAYSFTPTSGDTDNVVYGGQVINASLCRPININTAETGGNRFIGVNVLALDGASAPIIASAELYNCHFYLNESANVGFSRVDANEFSLKMVGGSITNRQDGNRPLVDIVSPGERYIYFDNVAFNLASRFRLFVSLDDRASATFKRCSFNFEDVDSPRTNSTSFLWGKWDALFEKCTSNDAHYFVYYSVNPDNKLVLIDNTFSKNCTLVGGSDTSNRVEAEIDLSTLQSVHEPGTGIITYSKSKQNTINAASVDGVVGVYEMHDRNGAFVGYVPVYSSYSTE